MSAPVEPWRVDALESELRRVTSRVEAHITTLDTRVTSAESAILANAADITTLETQVSGWTIAMPRAEDLSWLAREHGVVPEQNSPLWVVLAAAAHSDGQPRALLLAAVERMAGNPLLACPMAL